MKNEIKKTYRKPHVRKLNLTIEEHDRLFPDVKIKAEQASGER